jgi:hypothetical protein
LFAPDCLRRIVAEHLRGDANHEARLWTLINFEVWARQFVDGERLFANE